MGERRQQCPRPGGGQKDLEQRIPELPLEGGTGLKPGTEAAEGTADTVRGRSKGLRVQRPFVAKLTCVTISIVNYSSWVM